MTFRIFSDDARKTIADHIYGSPPTVQNRFGSNLGTDLLHHGGNTPQEYDPRVGGEYRPQGGYDPQGGNQYPPTTGPGQTPQVTCNGGRPADQSGSCPPPETRNGKTITWRPQKDPRGLTFCCPSEASPGDAPVLPPMTYGQITQKMCGNGPSRTIALYSVASANTAKAEQPFAGKTPLQFEAELKSNCGKTGGTFNRFNFRSANGAAMVAVGCCGPLNLPTGTPGQPPTTTPVEPGPTQTREYDGDDKNSTPEAPGPSQIVFRARPLADIPAGGLGWCATTMDLISFDKDCSKVKGATLTTAKSTDPQMLPTKCSLDYAMPMIFARNPGAAVIERGVPVIAVKDFANTSGGVQRATIVVVPCSS